MKLTLYVWRQEGPEAEGRMVRYQAEDIDEHMSFLEMLDVVNEGLISRGEEPIAFDSDCREGICGTCGLMVNGYAHGPDAATAVCQLHMRRFSDGDTIYVEPWRAEAFPIVKDLVVDRSALDRIIEAGGFISVNTGSAPDANTLPVAKEDVEDALDAAVCIGCGACVAACPNRSAMLFTGAKLAHLGRLPQGMPEQYRRTRRMVEAMDAAGFGGCTNHYECVAACPVEISADVISRMNRDYMKARLKYREE